VTIYENFVGVTGRGAKAEGLAAKQEKELHSRNAMILPCPLKAGSTVQLLDLSKDAFRFDSLQACFPVFVEQEREKSRGRSALHGHAKKLEVHQVGAYQMSVALSLPDLARIDPSVFVVAPNIQALMSKHYSNGFGFIICVFDPSKEMKPHPIGYVHDKLSATELFVPCRHEHGHGDQQKERFDHFLYSLGTTAAGEAGQTPAEAHVALEARAKGPVSGIVQTPKTVVEAVINDSAVLKPLLVASTVLRRSILQGMHDNKDLVFTVTA
jgi:hypothetical protein